LISLRTPSARFSRIEGLLISPIRKKKRPKKGFPLPSTIIRTTGLVPPIPRFVLPSSAVSCKPHALLVLTNYSDRNKDSLIYKKKTIAEKKFDSSEALLIGIFPDENSAKERKRFLIEERKKQLHRQRQFLSGDWNADADYIIKPV
jgi:hypothetical protein